MKKFLVISALLVTTGSAFANANYSYEQPAEPNNYSITNTTLKGSVVTVPAGETFRAVVTAPISSETAVIGQNVTMALGSDYYYNGNVIAPAGSTIYGTVLEVSKAKHGSLNGKLLVRFTQIITPTGQNIPISAIIKTNDNTGVLIGGTKMDVTKEYAKDLTVGAGAGALAGVIISPLSGGSVGKGTALATAVGAGGGLIKSVWDKGNDVVLPTNATVELILTQPITVNPTNTENKPFGQ